jgi:hypothetical protein
MACRFMGIPRSLLTRAVAAHDGRSKAVLRRLPLVRRMPNRRRLLRVPLRR